MADGALKVGDVYVSVSVAMGDAAASLQRFAKSVEDTAKKVKESAGAIANVGALFAAGMGGAVAAAAQSNRAIQEDLKRLKEYVYTLAADFGDAFGPALKQLTTAVGSIVGAVQRLSPEVREGAARFVLLAASAGGAAGLLSKGAGLVEGLAKATGAVLVPAVSAASKAMGTLGSMTDTLAKARFPGLAKSIAGMEAGVVRSALTMTASFAGVLVPVLAVSAAVAALVALAGVLYQVWRDNGGAIKATLSEVWEWLKRQAAAVAETYMQIFATFRETVVSGARLLLQAVTAIMRTVGKTYAPMARGFGMTGLASTLEDMSLLTADSMLKGLTEGMDFLGDKAAGAAAFLVDGAKETGAAIADGVQFSVDYSLRGLKNAAKDSWLANLFTDMRSVLGGVLGGPKGRIRSPLEDVEVSKVGRGGGLPSAALEFARGGRSAAMQARLRAVAEQARRLAEEAARAMQEVRDSLVNRMLGALGRMSTVVTNAVQAALAGGPLAALGSIGVDLLTQSEGMRSLTATLEGGLQRLADALGQFLAPLEPLVAVLFRIVDSLMVALAPALNSLAAVIEPLVPPLVILGELFAALAPLIAMAVQVVQLILAPMRIFAGPAMKALFEVLKFVSNVILTIARGVAGVWNGILGAIQAVLRTIGGFSILGAKPFGFLEDWADGLDRAKLDTNALAEAQRNLNAITWESAKEKAAETAEVLKNREALKKATESLTNVPTIFKAQLRRYQSESPVLPTVPGSGGGWSSGPAAPAAGHASPPPGVPAGPATPAVQMGDVYITGMDPHEAMQELQRTAETLAARYTGNRDTVQPRYSTP